MVVVASGGGISSKKEDADDDDTVMLIERTATFLQKLSSNGSSSLSINTKEEDVHVKEEEESKSSPTSPRLEVKFPHKEGGTVLSNMIWNGQWDQATLRLKTHSQEVRQQVNLTCFDHDNGNNSKIDKNNKYNCQGLPLHLACSMRPLPPLSFLKFLLDAYPEAVSNRRNAFGILPLHLLCDLTTTSSNSDNDERRGGATLPHEKHDNNVFDLQPPASMVHAIKLVVSAHPDALYIAEFQLGMLPLHIAASSTRSTNGIISDPIQAQTLQFLYDKAPSAATVPDQSQCTPVLLAWRHAHFSCDRCGHDQASMPCACLEPATKSTNSDSNLHPLLPLGDPVEIQKKLRVIDQAVVLEQQVLQQNEPQSRQDDDDDDEEAKTDIVSNRSSNTTKEKEPSLSAFLELSTNTDEPRDPSEAAEASRSIDSHSTATTTTIGSSTAAAPGATTTFFRFEDEEFQRFDDGAFPVTPSEHFKETLKIVGTEENDTAVLKKKKKKSELRKSASSASSAASSIDFESVEDRIRIKPVDIAEVQKILSQQAIESERKVKFQLDDSSGQPSKHQNALLRVKLSMSQLKRPRSGKLVTSVSTKPPNPYFEITITTNNSVASYRSYPIHHVRDATWDDAVVDLGIPKSQVNHLNIDIKVFHCRKKGGGGTLIGIVRPPKDGESTFGKPHPLTSGFQVTGWIRLLSMKIE